MITDLYEISFLHPILARFLLFRFKIVSIDNKKI